MSTWIDGIAQRVRQVPCPRHGKRDDLTLATAVGMGRRPATLSPVEIAQTRIAALMKRAAHVDKAPGQLMQAVRT